MIITIYLKRSEKMVEIKDETDIEIYLRAIISEITEIKSFKYVDVDDDLEEIVSGHMANHYKGPVVFFSMHEQKMSLSSSLHTLKPQCQLTVLASYKKNNPADLITVRQQTRVWITKLINRMQEDYEKAREAAFESPNPAGGGHWRFQLHNGLILPIGNINNSGTRGWSMDFEISFPVTETRI
jgi:hypothetical protein